MNWTDRAWAAMLLGGCLLLTGAWSSTTRGQDVDPLLWRLPADGDLQVVADETTDVQTRVGEATLRIQARSRLEMTWKASSWTPADQAAKDHQPGGASRKGRAAGGASQSGGESASEDGNNQAPESQQRIAVTLDRIAWRFAADGVSPEQYDSKTPLDSESADNDDINNNNNNDNNDNNNNNDDSTSDPLQGLVGGEILTFTLDPSGKLSRVSLSDASREALRRSTRATALQKLLSAERLEQLLQSLLIPLPGQAAPGERWSRTRRTIASLGVLDQIDRFQYLGKSEDGEWRNVAWATEATLNGQAAADAELIRRGRARGAQLREFSQRGAWWISEGAPFQVRAEVTQHLVTESFERDAENATTSSRRRLRFGIRISPQK